MKGKSNKNKKKSEMNAMFFVILLALVMFIISTYAWFSTQKNVSITNLTGTVEVAEGLEISLDAENWSNGLVLGTEEGQLSIIDDAYSGHHNISPSEMLPVSTLGLVTGNQTDLKMLRGKITNSKELSEIKSMIETETAPASSTYPGYFAFDVFLKNSSKQEVTDDILQLNYDSSLEILEAEKSATGLQNTARIAFAKYNGKSDVMADQATILKETAGIGVGAPSPYITDVAIWEPNASGKALDADGAEVTTGGTISTYAAHVTYIVQNNNRVRFSAADRQAAGLGADSRFAADTAIPTYALTSSSVGKEIADIYDWQTDRVADTQTGVTAYVDNGLVKQKTLQTPNTGVSKTTGYDDEQQAIPLVSVTDTDGTKKFAIAPGKYVRMRMYIWLEGQDVDCINYASLGGNLTIDVGLSKPGTK